MVWAYVEVTVIFDDLTADVARDSFTVNTDNFIALTKPISIAAMGDID